MTLTEFLLERIAEDDANAADCGGWPGCQVVDAVVERRIAECEAKRQVVGLHGNDFGQCSTCGHEVGWTDDGEGGEYQSDHRYPDTFPCATLRLLAVPYSDHPDYRQEWKP